MSPGAGNVSLILGNVFDAFDSGCAHGTLPMRCPAADDLVMDNAQKWELRRRRATDIVLSSDGNIEHVDWTTIRRWQREFQRDYCAQCRHHTAPRDDRNDCALHWTDIVGQCWNFERREAA